VGRVVAIAACSQWDVVGTLTPIACPAQELDVRNGVASALTPRDHMVEVEFNGRAAQTTPATVTCGYSDLHILTDGAGVALPDRSLVIWNPETPARRSGRPQRVGKPTRFRCPSERRYRPAGRRVEPNRRRRRVRLSHRTKSRVRGYPSTTVHSNTVDCVPDQGNDYWDGSVPA
jgi:hypothetical protein